MTQQDFFNRYQYNPRTDKIGGGSFGTVYKAYDNVLDKYVAIKISEVKSIGGKDFSLMDEFDAIKDLPPHTNIANYEKVYVFEQPNGVFAYAIIQYYPHGNFKALMEARVLSLAEKEDLAHQLLNGLEFLHNHHVVHRDMKPSNVLIHQRQINNIEKIIVKIADFGLSKKATPGDMSRFTNSFGGGTLEYSSPEQLKAHPLRYNTDLWAWGAIAYELFTAKPLFNSEGHSTGSAEKEKDIFEQIINKDISKALEQTNIPANWKQAIAACLVRDPEQRVKNVAAIRSILAVEGPAAAKQEFYTGGTVIVEDKPPVQPAAPPVKPVGTPIQPSPPKAEPKPAPTPQPATAKKPAGKKILIAAIVIVLVVAAGIATWLWMRPAKENFTKTIEFNGPPGMKIVNNIDYAQITDSANGKYIFGTFDNAFYTITKDTNSSTHSIPYFHDSLDGHQLNIEIDNNRLFINGRLKTIVVDSLWDWSRLEPAQIKELSLIHMIKKKSINQEEYYKQVNNILSINPYIYIDLDSTEKDYELARKMKPPYLHLPTKPSLLRELDVSQVKTITLVGEQKKDAILSINPPYFPKLKNLAAYNFAAAKELLKNNYPESFSIILTDKETFSDLSFLKSQPGLKHLQILENAENRSELSGTLDGYEHLTSFSYYGKSLSTGMINGLKNFTTLSIINISLSNLSTITINNPELRHLTVSFPGNVQNLNALKSVPKLETFCLLNIEKPDDFARVIDVSALKELKSLRGIGLPQKIGPDHELYRKIAAACPNAVIYSYEFGMCMGSGWLLLLLPVIGLFLLIKWRKEKRALKTITV